MATIFYHAHCFDGLASAHTARTAMQNRGIECELLPVKYGEPLPKFNSSTIYFVDWCPTQDMLRGLAGRAQKIVIIDHHVGALTLRDNIPNMDIKDTEIELYVDDKHCGCILTSKYFGLPLYKELVLIDDRDRWQHVFGDETLANYLSMAGLKTIDEYDAFIRSDYKARLERGLIQVDLYKRLINASIPSAHDLPKYFVNGRKIGVVSGLSLPLSSDACHTMLLRDTSLDAVVNVHVDLEKNIVHMSWRSIDGESAYAMATMFTGGGGHPNAAGARCSIEDFRTVIYDTWPTI